jgi:hypothetical protein
MGWMAIRIGMIWELLCRKRLARVLQPDGLKIRHSHMWNYYVEGERRKGRSRFCRQNHLQACWFLHEPLAWTPQLLCVTSDTRAADACGRLSGERSMRGRVSGNPSQTRRGMLRVSGCSSTRLENKRRPISPNGANVIVFHRPDIRPCISWKRDLL